MLGSRIAPNEVGACRHIPIIRRRVIKTQPIPEEYLDLFEKQAFAHLATLMPDGRPQVTPVWVDYDGTHVLVNTARGRQKDQNLQRDGRVAVDVQDPDNAYRYLSVRGRAVELTDADADDHIDRMARKYLGQDTYPYRAPDEVQVLYRIDAERVHGTG